MLKKIKVDDFKITKTGIEIGYFLECEEKSLSLNPEQSCKALFKAGIIIAWLYEDDQLMVRIELEDGVTPLIAWETFVLDIGLYKYAAKVLAANHELTIQPKIVKPEVFTSEWFSQILGIYNPSHIK